MYAEPIKCRQAKIQAKFVASFGDAAMEMKSKNFTMCFNFNTKWGLAGGKLVQSRQRTNDRTNERFIHNFKMHTNFMHSADVVCV